MHGLGVIGVWRVGAEGGGNTVRFVIACVAFKIETDKERREIGDRW